MKFSKRIFLIVTLVAFIVQFNLAESFIVRHIEVDGLQHLSEGTVLSNLPVHVGSDFTESHSSDVLQSLYQTGFFNDVRLYRRADTLVISVKERPAIGLIKITGNKEIASDKLQTVLQKMGITEGQIFDSSKLNEITQGLHQQYDMLGLYAAKIDTQVIPESKNRVTLKIHIDEGPIVKVGAIHTKGNVAFREHTLLKSFKLSKTNIFTFYTHADRYSQAQFEQDLDSLRNFYLDHGYLEFQVVSRDVQISPDHKKAYLTVVVSEGPQYHISGYSLQGPYADNKAVKKIAGNLHSGEVFSRAKIMAINKAIENYLATRGYAFSRVMIQQRLNPPDHTLFLILSIETGRYVYVHEINFVGNSRTQDKPLRMRLRQMEGSVYSLSRVNESKRLLANLPYLQDITVDTIPVPGLADQVDLNYHVTEVNAGKASVNGGYSDVDGFMYGASISEPNFMGTGKFLGLNYTRNGYQSDYQFSYNNPFYTIDGVSRGFNLYYNHATPNRKLGFDPFTMDDFGGSVTYGIPISGFNMFSVGYGYDNIKISGVRQVVVTNDEGKLVPSSSPAAPGVLEFTRDHTRPFNQFNITTGISHSTLDRAVFPNSGNAQSISVINGLPLLGTNNQGKDPSVGYYKGVYSGAWYWPLGYGFVFNPHTSIGFGGGYGKESVLPFYDNFYMGGITTLPGFEPNTLGPRNPNTGFNPKTGQYQGRPLAIGGNFSVLGGLNFIFPNFISERIRTGLILDAGNVFQTDRIQYSKEEKELNPHLKPIIYEDISFKNIRVSTGLMISWYSPIGPLEFSIARAIVKKSGDQLALFGFSFGTSF